jgi:2-phosphosulfolactate phosphatase
MNAIHLEWGPHGALADCQPGDLAVVVDVLSFTTTLTVALDAGVEVYPYPLKDASAAGFARQRGAALATGRFEARLGEPGATVSLSPASMRAAAGLTAVVLPSPNGSALARALGDRGARVVGAALRNRAAVAHWIAEFLSGNGKCGVSVIAAGERWSDGSLRPAAEDLWGAGALIAALADLGVGPQSAEARVAQAAFRDVAGRLPAELGECVSGRELIDVGFGDDVTIAAELDSSRSVPVLSGERFVNAAARN